MVCWLETGTSAKKIVGYNIWQNGIARVRRDGIIRRDGELEGELGGGGRGLVKVEHGPWLSRAGRDTTPIFFMAEVSPHTDNAKVQVEKIGSDLTIYPLKESVSDIPLPATYDITTKNGKEYKYAYAKLNPNTEQLFVSYNGGPSMGKISFDIPFSDISTMTVPQ